MAEQWDVCTRGHRLWPGLLLDSPCPVYGCKGTVRGEGDGLAGVREPRRPSPSPLEGVVWKLELDSSSDDAPPVGATVVEVEPRPRGRRRGYTVVTLIEDDGEV